MTDFQDDQKDTANSLINKIHLILEMLSQNRTKGVNTYRDSKVLIEGDEESTWVSVKLRMNPRKPEWVFCVDEGDVAMYIPGIWIKYIDHLYDMAQEMIKKEPGSAVQRQIMIDDAKFFPDFN